MTTVTITTGARLHFGPLSVEAPAGGKFGGVGVMIDSPRVSLTARRADVDRVVGDESIVPRVSDFLHRIRQAMPEGNCPACEMTVTESIPSHRGFGSGTQLGLAVARALSTLENEVPPALDVLARRVGRGLRSAIGLHGFDQGGFLVDGGRPDSSRLGTLVSRVPFPADWRFVIAAPKQTIGLSGQAEQSAFARQPPMPATLTGTLCRIVLMDWLPAVIESDFARCGDSLSEFGNAVGEFFSVAQGGVFANRRMSEWASLLRRRGIRGIAQTSWGPTVAALCPNQASAEQIQHDFTADSGWSDCTFEIASPLNRGAEISVSSSGT